MQTLHDNLQAHWLAMLEAVLAHQIHTPNATSPFAPCHKIPARALDEKSHSIIEERFSPLVPQDLQAISETGTRQTPSVVVLRLMGYRLTTARFAQLVYSRYHCQYKMPVIRMLPAPEKAYFRGQIVTQRKQIE